jgi:hypothetical protein
MTCRTEPNGADAYREIFASEARDMRAAMTSRAGEALEARAFRPNALWLLGSALGLICLPGLAVTQLPEPQRLFEVGFLIMVLVAVAAELLAVARPAGAFSNVLVPGDAVLVFGLAFADPLLLLAARLSVTAGSDALRRRHPAKIGFNAALTAAETIASVAVHRAILYGGDVASGRGVAASAAAVAMATVVGLIMLVAVHALHDERISRRTLAIHGGLALAGLAAGLGLVMGLSALAN